MKYFFSQNDSSAGEALLGLKEIQAIRRPTTRAQRNLHNLIHNTQSFVQGEAEWIRQGPDLAAVGCGTEYGWLNTFLEDAVNWLPRRATLVSLTPIYLIKEYIPCSSPS